MSSAVLEEKKKKLEALRLKREAMKQKKMYESPPKKFVPGQDEDYLDSPEKQP